MRTWKRVTALIVAGLMAIGLTGCSETVEKDSCVDIPGDQACSVKVPIGETRYVTCVAVTSGLSCDWAHADGADHVE